jgi:Transposase DDE domain
MTKRYFGRDGQRITRSAEPEPEEWIPIVERVAASEISLRAASDHLGVSVSRVKTMLAHVRGEIVDPTIARNAMNDKLSQPENAALYRKRAVSIEPVFGNIKANLGFRKFSLRGCAGVHSEWRLICTVHNLLKLQHAIPA